MQVPFRENCKILVVHVYFEAFCFPVAHAPEEVLRTVHFDFPSNLDFVHKSCDINARADQSSFIGAHVPGEEQLSILLVVQAVSVVEFVRAGEPARLNLLRLLFYSSVL